MQRLFSANIETPLGLMKAIADEKAVYFLGFADWRGLERALQRVQAGYKNSIVELDSEPLTLLRKELEAYFAGKLFTFTTPLGLPGTSFQKLVWRTLQQIPYGRTTSYAAVAQSIGAPTAFRAVANANGTNMCAIVVPCHRVIKSNGDLCGYNSGIDRKKWLLAHELRFGR